MFEIDVSTDEYEMMQYSLIIRNNSMLPLVWSLLLALVTCQEAFASNSLRFFGTPSNDDQRVKIQIDDPTNSNPGPPADIGSEDFTLEFWMKAASGNDADGFGSPCGAGVASWINGNIIFDRDRFNQGRSYGISIVNGILRFGLDNATQSSHTICGASNVLDGQWHHTVIQRRRSDGWMWLYIDGKLDAEADGPDGDISYPDDGIPGNFCRGGSCDFSDPYLVIGAEKHDADVNVYPSYSGFIDEVRLSKSIRYTTESFNVPTQQFITDNNTVALYHFNEGIGTVVNDTSGAAGGPSNGEIRPGVVWVTDTPFSTDIRPIPGIIGLSVSAANVGEADANYTFRVIRSGGAGAVSVEYVIGEGSATPGIDYAVTAQPVSGTLNWGEGDTSARTLIIDVLDDTVPEENETVGIMLRNAKGGASIGTTSATLLIEDNDTDNPSPATDGGSGSLDRLSIFIGLIFISLLLKRL